MSTAQPQTLEKVPEYNQGKSELSLPAPGLCPKWKPHGLAVTATTDIVWWDGNFFGFVCWFGFFLPRAAERRNRH